MLHAFASSTNFGPMSGDECDSGHLASSDKLYITAGMQAGTGLQQTLSGLGSRSQRRTHDSILPALAHAASRNERATPWMQWTGDTDRQLWDREVEGAGRAAYTGSLAGAAFVS